MRAIGTSGLGIGVSGLLRSAASLTAQDMEPASAVVKDRQPLLSSAFFPLPLGSTHPRGWLWDQLPIQANGLTGHLGEIWPDAGPNSGWLQRFVDWTLGHGWPNGMIGPAQKDDWWPRIVMLKALAQYQELSGDTRVIPMMDKYFQY